VRVNRLSRAGVVARLISEAAKRGAITNIAGRYGTWWRKDAQEYALRAHERITGRYIPRPATIVLSGRQLPVALRQLALAGRHAMIKPVKGSGGAQLAVVDPGGRFMPRDPDGRYVVQPVVRDPFLLGGHKADLRFYLLIDTASRQNSRRLATAFVRMAAMPYVHGQHDAEIANTSLRLRAKLPPAIWPLDELVAWPQETRRLISERLDELAETLLDAAFHAAAQRAARASRQVSRRVLFWGLDALLTGTESDPYLEFLEVNIHPHLYREARHCDETMDAFFRYAILPAAADSRPRALARSDAGPATGEPDPSRRGFPDPAHLPLRQPDALDACAGMRVAWL
jgi:hypothetical protein